MMNGVGLSPMRFFRLLYMVPFCLWSMGTSAQAFEGALRYNLSIHDKPATSFVYRSQSGDLRVDLDVMDPRLKRNVRTSIVILTGNTDEAWQIVHNTKTFGRVLLPPPEKNKEGRYDIQLVGKASIQGRTTHIVHLVDTMSGDKYELWLDPTIQSAFLLDKVFQSVHPHAGSLHQELVKKNLAGMPLKFVYHRKLGGIIQGEAEYIDENKLKGETFNVPKGYIRGPLPVGFFSPMPGGENDPLNELKSLFKRGR